MNDAFSQADGWAGTIRGKPRVGQVAERARRTRMDDVEAFSGMTGDHNPLHYDKDLAESRVFGKLIVQGGVTSGLLNACVAESLPGPGTVFLSCDWRFLKAVGVGETITARVEVLTVRDDKPICTLKTAVTNEDGDTCLEGIAATFTVPLHR
ncbi:MaoC family dehydratase [Phenylobacterium sp. Root700]|uniref:MaoC family dehydratase n=1 Tax=Phenylobacterium sp. Root700 TaxID=1736591 RepID=UPI0006F5A988|nr:MaoC family dehydratase [Phenylobacterium sp. Root700]KRB49656.1 acyl dehydratase [Phenylobacterium sp. Root700]